MRRVAVTGLGAVTPLGRGVSATWEGLLAGRSGVRTIETFDASTFPVGIAGQVPVDDAAGPADPDGLPPSRAARFGFWATDEALHDAGLHDAMPYPPSRRSLVIGGAAGRPDLRALADFGRRRACAAGYAPAAQTPADVLVRDHGAALDVIARGAGIEGAVQGPSTACATSMHSIGEAMRLLQDDQADLVLAGAAESLTGWLDVLGFALLGALARGYEDRPERASRPFSRDRAGFVLGEGSVILVLEELEAARARGAHVYGELAGYGSSMNAYRMTDPPPDGSGLDIAMRRALGDAQCAPETIGYVCAHGTGTAANDAAETAAIRTVFGEHADRLLVSSPKSMTGHLTGAAGALGVAVALLAMRDAIVPPTINLDEPDPALDLDYVPHAARRVELEACLANAFAFGGTNGSVVVRGV